MLGPVKVLVVDDSAFMRKAISGMLNSDPDIRVIGEAVDGEDAVLKVKSLVPDVVTMDIEMPKLNGLDALRHLMKNMPVPVIMVSSLTEQGAKQTMMALEIGAVDYVPKHLSGNIININNIKADICSKVKLVGRSGYKMKKLADTWPATVLTPDCGLRKHVNRFKVVIIGSSTGGPKSLHDVIPRLPKNFPAGVLIVQHMLPLFTAQFAERMGELSQMEVKEAQDNDIIRPGLALIAKGGAHLIVERGRTGEVHVKLKNEPKTVHMPSVDIAMESVARTFAEHALGVIMTGMGQDGCEGLKMIKQMKGMAMAQDEETSVIFGMPKAAIDSGVVDKIVPLESIADEIIKMM
ncbi:MAG: chemotaxis response regulator protein-glutamate methylesterase [Nitrospirae bacterium]|nr:chemotaxis response regulator protein-glutamate methylesterase [Nitrospirota bacterium]